MKFGSTTHFIRHSKKHSDDFISSGNQTQNVINKGNKFYEAILKEKLI